MNKVYVFFWSLLIFDGGLIRLIKVFVFSGVWFFVINRGFYKLGFFVSIVINLK